ncbi:MAG: hypothetical protein IJC98_08035 [Clostridia bacterium]|nr:hypothetical protein [Clostridia bacterium]
MIQYTYLYKGVFFCCPKNGAAALFGTVQSALLRYGGVLWNAVGVYAFPVRI